MIQEAAAPPGPGGAGGIRTAEVAARIDPADADSVRGALDALDAPALRQLGREARQLLDEDGVTYRPAGRHADERWRLDPVPLVLDGGEWAAIEAGVIQRAELFNLVLTDLYGPRDLLRTGQLPPEVVYAHPGFLRPLDRVRLPGVHQLTICATDLMRDAAGSWRPVSDRTQVPSGAAYALANRSVLSRLVPELHRASRVERLAPYLRSLRSALQAAAPPRPDEPRIAVLTGGAGAETSFEHGHLAGLLGYPLVEGPDLAVRDGRLWLRSLGGTPAAIDVLLRRVDAWWCDPLELRGDSQLGAPGLVEATRRRGVSVVNGLGSGVLENAGLWAFLPVLSRALLGQDLQLEQARTLWFGDDEQRAEAEARFDELVIKPIARTTTEHLHDVRRLTRPQRDALLARVRAHPHRWVGQERVEGPATRSLSPDGRVVQARTVLRTFAVAAGTSYATMHGGLARVSDADRLLIANTLGAWSKDTWVLGGDHEVTEGFWLRPGPAVAADAPESVVSARTVENLLWFGRYAERAEAVVRLLRAIDDRRSEAFGGTPAINAVTDRLLAALTRVTLTLPGFEHDDELRADPDAELTALVLDAARSGTIAFSVDRLLGAARAVREQLSSDTWPVLTTLERLVLGDDEDEATLATDARGPAHGRGALGPLLTALLALQGLGAESLVRDPSWRFLDAGRRLERAQQLVRLLRATVVGVGDADNVPTSAVDTSPAAAGPAVAPAGAEPAATTGPAVDLATTSLLLESVLVACESIITYRRRYRSRAQLATVLELLLLDPDNPRSLRWQLDRLAATAPKLPDHPGEGQLSPVEEAVHAAGSALRTADVGQLHGEALLRFLDRLDITLQRAGNELTRTVFVGGPALRPLVEERTGTAGDVLLA